MRDAPAATADDGQPARRPVELAREPPRRLGALSIEPALRRLSRAGGDEAFLQPRIMQVLVALLRAEGRIVTREDLTASCWDGVVVGEDAINRVLVQLRRLSKGVAADCFRVETINKVGYRLLTDAEGQSGFAAEAPARRDDGRPRIWVLPFANMSGDAGQAYFSDGISEDIITDLSKVSALSVVARNTAFAARSAGSDVRPKAAELGVTHLVEGSVRWAGDHVRITAQLTDCAVGDHLWAERWDRELADIFALQDEISHAIVAALKLRLAPEEKLAISRRGTANPDAYNLYLQARKHYVSGNQGERARDVAIIQLCTRATEIDPGYARAWALMGLGQAWLQYVHGEGEGGLAAAERALALDPDLADAHVVKAKALDARGETTEAFAAIARALAQDPQSYEANETAALIHFRSGDMAKAAHYYEIASQLMEADFGSPGMLIGTYVALGEPERARRAATITRSRCEDVLAADPANGGALGFLVASLAALGERESAVDWIARALRIDPENRNMRYNFACSLCVLNDVDGAIDLLGPFFESVSPAYLDHALHDPDLKLVRADPRFDRMVAAARTRHAEASQEG